MFPLPLLFTLCCTTTEDKAHCSYCRCPPITFSCRPSFPSCVPGICDRLVTLAVRTLHACSEMAACKIDHPPNLKRQLIPTHHAAFHPLAILYAAADLRAKSRATPFYTTATRPLLRPLSHIEKPSKSLFVGSSSHLVLATPIDADR